MDLPEPDIRTIIKTFARFAGKARLDGFLSRDYNKSSSIHGLVGGGRDSYRDLTNYQGFNAQGGPGGGGEGDYNPNGQLIFLEIKDLDAQDLLEGSYTPSEEVAEAIEAVPVEGESALENIEFGFWIG
jgi:hypothetical protein